MANGTARRVYMAPEEFGAYAARVDALAANMSVFDRKLDELGQEIRKRGQPQYNLFLNGFTIVLIILGGLGTYLYIPLATKVDTISHDIGVTYMPKDTINEKVEASKDYTKIVSDAAKEREKFYADAAAERSRQISDRRDDWQRQTTDRIARDEAAIAFLRDNQVSRTEHEQHWKEVDALQQDFKSLFPLHDVISTMQRKLEMLEDNGGSTNAQPTGR